MVMNKIGLNLSILNNLTAPNISLGKTGDEIVDTLSTTTNQVTFNYFGLGVMVTLFFYLIWHLGRGNELLNGQYSSLRSVGISAGIVSMLGLMFLNLGFFTMYYHVVIFMGISVFSWLIIYIGNKK